MLKSSNYGFQFNGDNSNAQWHSNLMCDNWAGLALTNSAVIGPQGNPQNGCGNVWEPWTCTQWSNPGADNQTYCENSDPNQSPLFVVNTAACNPTANISFPPGTQPYQLLINIDDTPTNILAQDCYLVTPYILPPNWRQSNAEEGVTSIDEESSQQDNLAIYPNPTSGLLILKKQGKASNYSLQLHDVNGKLLMDENISISSEHQLNIQYLDPGIYFMILKDTETQTFVRKKIIKTN